MPAKKVDGRGELSGNKAIAATFRVTIPFALQLEPMTFMGGTATKIEAFEHDTRSKIRKGLKETSLVSNITNALPFGADVAILMSNDSMFPTDRSIEQMSLFRDTLAALGALLPTKILIKPEGAPARSASMANASADKGVSFAGLQTTAQPAASAGAIFRASMAFGKFHGVIHATTPMGCLLTTKRLS